MTNGKRTVVVSTAVLLVVVCLFPVKESTFEFDVVNFRLRHCTRARALAFGSVLWERCEAARDHPTAAELRGLSVLGPVRADATRWVLIKGARPGVRGWHGDGKTYLRALGETSFGTPVPLPADEDLNRNAWVRWAVHDPAASRRFWARVQNAPVRDYHMLALLINARVHLERHPLPANEVELEELVMRELDR